MSHTYRLSKYGTISSHSCDTAKCTTKGRLQIVYRRLYIRIVTGSVKELHSTDDLLEFVNCFFSNRLVAGVPVSDVFQLTWMTSSTWSVKVVVITYQQHTTVVILLPYDLLIYQLRLVPRGKKSWDASSRFVSRSDDMTRDHGFPQNAEF